MSKNVVTLKSGSKITQGHWKWYYSIVYGFLLVLFSIFVPKTHRFSDIRLVSIQWPWNQGSGSLKVFENYTSQSGSHDFLLTFHSNCRPILHHFRDKRRFPSKIANFFPTHPCVFNVRAEEVPLGIGIGARGRKSSNDGATRRSKKF